MIIYSAIQNRNMHKHKKVWQSNVDICRMMHLHTLRCNWNLLYAENFSITHTTNWYFQDYMT